MMRSDSLNIALVSSQSNWGGGEQLLFSLGADLEERGHQVTWIAPQASLLSNRLHERGSDCLTFEGRHPSPPTFLRIRREIDRREINVLHGNDAHAISHCGGLALGKQKRPLIIGVKHTVFPIRSATRYNWLVDRMVCVSRSVRDVCLDAGILDDRLRVVYGGIEMKPLDRYASRQAVCRELGIDEGLPLLCAAGSLIPCKGFDTLISAATHLEKELGEFCLAICGDGTSRPLLERQISRLGLQSKIKLLGFREDINRWIAAADVLVHPSRSEGLSLVTIAAQMLGTPVVASEVGGLREVMHCDETSRPLGWIFATHESSDLAELIVDAMLNQAKRRRLIEEAQLSAMKRFTVDAMTEGFLDVYAESSRMRFAAPSRQLSHVA